MSTVPSLTTDTLNVCPWPDDVIDALGHDPRSSYVEQFWLGILGPSTTWLLRRLADEFDEHPDGFELRLSETAHALGVGHMGGRHSPFARALARLCTFELAQLYDDTTLAVRRRVPPLSRRQVTRLSPALQKAHHRWQEVQLHTPLDEQLRQRSRRLALSLVELGEDDESAERQLHRWRFHPTLCREAIAWARARHLEAQGAAYPDTNDDDGPDDEADGAA